MKNNKYEIINENKDLYLDINYEGQSIINIKESTLNLYLLNVQQIKNTYNINISGKSFVNIFMFNSSENKIDKIDIKINGEKSVLNFYLSSISKNVSNYELNIYHNSNNITSNIFNRILNNGDCKLIVNEYVLKECSGCIIDQKSKIINIGDGTSLIEPNLFVDNMDTIAEHSATIGKFKEDEIFYLNSRGIDYNTAIKLLIKGFLLNKLFFKNIEVLSEIINKTLEEIYDN
ncbi:MAG: SufD family Fe-S cluster assembly protein [Bacilli bacterium]